MKLIQLKQIDNITTNKFYQNLHLLFLISYPSILVIENHCSIFDRQSRSYISHVISFPHARTPSTMYVHHSVEDEGYPNVSHEKLPVSESPVLRPSNSLH